jgi:hypothetical protein
MNYTNLLRQRTESGALFRMGPKRVLTAYTVKSYNPSVSLSSFLHISFHSSSISYCFFVYLVF